MKIQEAMRIVKKYRKIQDDISIIEEQIYDAELDVEDVADNLSTLQSRKEEMEYDLQELDDVYDDAEITIREEVEKIKYMKQLVEAGAYKNCDRLKKEIDNTLLELGEI